MFADDLLHVGRGLLAVPLPQVAGVCQGVLAAVHLEVADFQIAGDDGRIHQCVEIGGAVMVRLAAGRRVQACRGVLPLLRQDQQHIVRPPRLLGQREKRGRAVPHGVILADPVGGDRLAATEQAIGDDDFLCASGLDLPAIFLGLVHLERFAVGGLRHEIFDAGGVALDAVEAGRPDGHHQLDGVAPAGGDRGLNLGVVLGGVGDLDGVGDRLQRLGGADMRWRAGQPQKDDKRHAGQGKPLAHCVLLTDLRTRAFVNETLALESICRLKGLVTSFPVRSTQGMADRF